MGEEKDLLEIVINAPNLLKSSAGYPLYKTGENEKHIETRVLSQSFSQTKDGAIILRTTLRP